MGRAIGRLKPVELPRLAKRTGMHCDGGGLYLCVAPPNGCSWVFRYMMAKRPRMMGLGPFPDVSLADARALAAEGRRLKAQGTDPIEARRAKLVAAKLEAAREQTFKQCAEAYLADHETTWKNKKHREQWKSTLATYCYPSIGDLPVAAIDTALVTKILRPIWTAKTETASRVRSRIECVLDWATANTFRQGENPARWRGHLDKLLPNPANFQKVHHHTALPYAELPAFMAELRAQDGVGPRALEFLILTAARSGEVVGARWSEFNVKDRLWIIPAERMKEGREHRVPLTSRCLEIIEPLRSAVDGLVFEGLARDMLIILQRMKSGATVHGFRSSFRDWVAERTSFPSEVAEMALAHRVGTKTEIAYRRSDLFERRRALMADWAEFCGTPKPESNVASLDEHRARAGP